MAAKSTYPNEQALILAGLGDRDGAIDALSRMAVVGAQRVGLFLDSPEFASWRGDRRLEDLRRRVGLPDPPAFAR